jgi:hypothetical protein
MFCNFFSQHKCLKKLYISSLKCPFEFLPKIIATNSSIQKLDISYTSTIDIYEFVKSFSYNRTIKSLKLRCLTFNYDLFTPIFALNTWIESVLIQPSLSVNPYGEELCQGILLYTIIIYYLIFLRPLLFLIIYFIFVC